MATKKRRQGGFSLIELAIVITIVGVLLYTALSMGAGQAESTRTADTQQKLARIEDAITVFYNVNGYLPCPAIGGDDDAAVGFGTDPVTDAAHNAGAAGNSASTTNVACTGVYNTAATHPDAYIGVIPVRSLKLPDSMMYDGWGRRITYAVSRYCIARKNWQTIGDTAYTNKYKCSNTGAITGSNNNSGGTIQMININGTNWMGTDERAAYIIISHGKNGIGAWQRGGIKLTGDTSAAEKDNGSLSSTGTNNPTDYTSVNVTFRDQPMAELSTKYYDDIVRFRTPGQVDYDANN